MSGHSVDFGTFRFYDDGFAFGEERLGCRRGGFFGRHGEKDDRVLLLIEHLHLRCGVVDLPARGDRKLKSEFRVIKNIAFDITLARIFAEDNSIDLP